MKSKKIKLKELGIKSFVTDMQQTNSETVKGGRIGGATVGGGSDCPTVVTQGFWTVCGTGCDVETEGNVC